MMAKRLSRQESLESFIRDIKAALEARRARGETPPFVRRKLRTIASECGYERVMAAFFSYRPSITVAAPAKTASGAPLTQVVR